MSASSRRRSAPGVRSRSRCVPFGWRSQIDYLGDLLPEGQIALRTSPGGAPVETDQGNLILDLTTGPIANAEQLAARLETRAGIVAHGLFLGLATDVIVAGRSGVEHRTRG